MQKLYYSISEVSKLVDEEQHILRYWEKEFEELKPKKNRGGNRIYSEKDIIIIRSIKTLLRHNRLSLIGARNQLKTLLSYSIHEISNNKNVSININDSLNKNLIFINDDKTGILLSKQDAKELYLILKDILNFIK